MNVMVFSLHPLNSFPAGFFWKHLAIVVPFTVPPILIFAKKSDDMLAGDPVSLLWLLPAIFSLIVPHLYIRRRHLSIANDVPSVGSMEFSKDSIRLTINEKTKELSKSEVKSWVIKSSYLHRWIFGERGYTYVEIEMTTNSGEKQRFLLCTISIDGHTHRLSEAI